VKRRLDTSASKFLEDKFLRKREANDQVLQKYAEQLDLELKQVKAWWKRRTQKESEETLTTKDSTDILTHYLCIVKLLTIVTCN
jgi:hypothetical protein